MPKDPPKKHAAYIPATELTREFKLHVYRKRQTSDSIWEFLKREYD